MAVSSTESMQISLSTLYSDTEQHRSADATITGDVENNKDATNRRLLSEKAVRCIEVTFLTAVIVFVAGLFSTPAVLYFVKTVSVIAVLLKCCFDHESEM